MFPNAMWRASGRTDAGPIICHGYDLVSALEMWMSVLERRREAPTTGSRSTNDNVV